MSPVKSTSRTSLHSPGSTTSSSCSLSRIPRPVTSPVRPPTGIPLPRCATSPTQSQIPPLRKPSLPLPQVSSKIASKGLGQKNICCDLSLNIFSVFFLIRGKEHQLWALGRAELTSHILWSIEVRQHAPAAYPTVL